MTSDLKTLAAKAGMETDCMNMGAASCVYSFGLEGVTQDHLQLFAELVRADEREQCAKEMLNRLCEQSLAATVASSRDPRQVVRRAQGRPMRPTDTHRNRRVEFAGGPKRHVFTRDARIISEDQ